ncbi:MAG: Holliday junction branch migration protein RuvA [marine benthic group bacterium]|jgi:Holliday junction DNA helicase RuvA|nr:Holliday junction branch migration protein RuvA [Gemmatimonadota bacterium]MCL7963222.1 Holliday junction branch migration protein RuvA [Candidatus Carthagonibacter metallireducens]MCL7938434.1 Holliday junction branch migration protein RuvA [Gemmatimonadota bacterium]MCL7956561.1 Holliday junction branch migration protein RuvA [Gemmatimonadota bacterium]MCL7964207.1 Holliday junction branch migration protein RuvA [Gemmatimonadota bacterium]
MIGRVRGALVEVKTDRVTLMTPGGVGYVLHVPTGVFEGLPAIGETVELYATLAVREDTLLLFGFVTDRDRDLFLRLRTVSGVGPMLSLAILSALPARRVVGAIRSKEAAVLQTVSGVGKKTAERLVLELSDKLDDLGWRDDGVRAGTGPGGVAEALEALRALGYSAAEAESAVAAARREAAPEILEIEALVRAALRHL